MPVFEYRGLDKSGKNVKGIIDSENSRSARAKLRKQGVFVVDIKDKTKSVKKIKTARPAPTKKSAFKT